MIITKQKIVRTYNADKGYISNIDKINNLLDKGYKIKFITPVGDDYIEYVLEK